MKWRFSRLSNYEFSHILYRPELKIHSFLVPVETICEHSKSWKFSHVFELTNLWDPRIFSISCALIQFAVVTFDTPIVEVYPVSLMTGKTNLTTFEKCDQIFTLLHSLQYNSLDLAFTNVRGSGHIFLMGGEV